MFTRMLHCIVNNMTNAITFQNAEILATPKYEHTIRILQIYKVLSDLHIMHLYLYVFLHITCSTVSHRINWISSSCFYSDDFLWALYSSYYFLISGNVNNKLEDGSYDVWWKIRNKIISISAVQRSMRLHKL